MKSTSWLLLAPLLLAACSPALPLGSTDRDPGPTPGPTASQPATAAPTSSVADSGNGVRKNSRVDDFDAQLPPQMIPPDGIRPVYDPQFVSADEAPMVDEELVIGVAWDGGAKAYPITVLRFREMVNDEMRGIPTLVTW